MGFTLSCSASRRRVGHQSGSASADREVRIQMRRVAFDDSDDRSLGGVSTRYNEKTVTVLSDDGRRWIVSPGSLRGPVRKDVMPEARKVMPMEPRS